MMPGLFALPNEVILSALDKKLPCRQSQIRALATLLSIRAAPVRNIVLHGLEATGKSYLTQSLLQQLSSAAEEYPDDDLRYVIIKSAECISGRQLLEQTTLAIATVTGYKGLLGRCENLAQLVVDIGMLQEEWTGSNAERKRLVLVFDGIDTQREAPHTLVPALARLSEIIPSLTTIFITTSPPPHFLHISSTPHIHFPQYTKSELLTLLFMHTPKPALPSGAADTTDVWSRYGAIIYDTLSKNSGRDILSFRSVCDRLWPKFIKPILDNQLSPSPFSKLVLANRSLLQNESILLSTSTSTTPQQTSTTLPSQLPHTSRILLLSSYLCSHNPPKTDMIYFCKSLSSSTKRRKRATTLSSNLGTKQAKNRKISRRLLGAQVFTLERMLAVFQFLWLEASHSRSQSRKEMRQEKEVVNGSADVLSGISTLVSLRLISKVGGTGAGGSDILDGGARYRVNVGWDLVRSLGRSVGVEIEELVAE